MEKYIKYLNETMNTHDVLYFKQNNNNSNIIDAYFKINDEHFTEFYKDMIDKVMGQCQK